MVDELVVAHLLDILNAVLWQKHGQLQPLRSREVRFPAVWNGRRGLPGFVGGLGVPSHTQGVR